jgi:hypothetical protein
MKHGLVKMLGKCILMNQQELLIIPIMVIKNFYFNILNAVFEMLFTLFAEQTFLHL